MFFQEKAEDGNNDGMLSKKKGDEDLKGASEVEDDGSNFDTNNVKLFIEDQTNLLFVRVRRYPFERNAGGSSG